MLCGVGVDEPTACYRKGLGHVAWNPSPGQRPGRRPRSVGATVAVALVVSAVILAGLFGLLTFSRWDACNNPYVSNGPTDCSSGRPDAAPAVKTPPPVTSPA